MAFFISAAGALRFLIALSALKVELTMWVLGRIPGYRDVRLLLFVVRYRSPLAKVRRYRLKMRRKLGADAHIRPNWNSRMPQKFTQNAVLLAAPSAAIR